MGERSSRLPNRDVVRRTPLATGSDLAIRRVSSVTMRSASPSLWVRSTMPSSRYRGMQSIVAHPGENRAPPVFADDRYFDVEVEHAKAGPEDILCRVTVHNRSAQDAALHVLPTLWFRNVWSWESGEPKPRLARVEAAHPVVRAEHHKVGVSTSTPSPKRTCCSVRTKRTRRGYSAPRPATPFAPGRHRRPPTCTARTR